MFPVSGVVTAPNWGNNSGGGTTNPPPTTGLSEEQVRAIVTGYNYVTASSLGPSQNQIQAWIRGAGMFRRVLTCTGSHIMDDDSWQSFLITPDVQTATFISVRQPSNALVSQTSYLTPAGSSDWTGTGGTLPAGAWTLIMNPNSVFAVTLEFPEPNVIVFGRDVVDNVDILSNSPFTIVFPNRRTVLLMSLGPAYYYILVL